VSERQSSTVAILAGIDEAGFGPLLGPLVVSSCAFAVGAGQTRDSGPAGGGDGQSRHQPGSLLEADLWQVLKRSVGKARRHLAGRLLVADSKKAYHRAQGLGHLERTVLAALWATGVETQDIASLLGALGPDCLPRLREYPWFQNLQNRRLGAEPADLKIAVRVLTDDLQAQGAKLVCLRSHCLDVAYYNTMIERVRNKAQVLFIAVTQLVQGLLDQFSDECIHILVDRQGGRAHYRAHLQRSFSGMDLRIVQEGDEVSTYELRLGSRLVRLSFEVKADDLHLPVALASMVSKYLRELLMECMNDYFVALDPDLAPTAGYWQDGQRFVAELRQRLPDLGIDDRRLIRCR
jgi:ribonuclease HII